MKAMFGSDGTKGVRKTAPNKLNDPHKHRIDASLRVGKAKLGDLRTSTSPNTAGQGRGKKG
jgi:hypothetical protein